MMNIQTFHCNILDENCYVVSDDSCEAVIIDCGALYSEERQAIVRYLSDRQLLPVRLLCTHGHLDHCFGNGFIEKTYGLRPEVHASDEFLITNISGQARDFFGLDFNETAPQVGRYLMDGETIIFGHHKLKVIPTPGHTPGGVSFYCEEEHVVFTGDTLFRMSIGRTDFEQGSWTDMLHSLQQVLAKLPPETVVYPGHGPSTKIG
ncbi:MAG: MBL fold metallo-hydrolase, partial [Bacteroidaceae bacterium]|nr:MBL fold metallo-hydrolase [Bacteroidaceae bacterium]